MKTALAPSLLLLVAEMKVPGIATLEFTLEELGENKTSITQAAYFYPSGLLGIIYWKLMVPFHFFIFNGMLQGIAKSARSRKRYKCHQSISFEINKEKFQGTLIDISESGCKIESKKIIERKYPIVIYMDKKVRTGRIVNIKKNLFGVQFDHLYKVKE